MSAERPNFSLMSNKTPITTGSSSASTPVTPTPVVALPRLDPVKALAALGDPVRWYAVWMMSGGKTCSATQIASALKRGRDGVSQHLHVLEEAGVVASQPGEDRRHRAYYIPQIFRPQPGVVDYGFCLLRFPVAQA